jgi:hypothetical protein
MLTAAESKFIAKVNGGEDRIAKGSGEVSMSLRGT